MSDTDTWNTPAAFLELVRRVMGGIDVDPASNDDAQAVVRAEVFYVAPEDALALAQVRDTGRVDGLVHPWSGRVYLNPPYSNVAPFVTKLLEELDAGRATEAIVLVNARTGSGWFQALAARAWRCDIRERPKFWNAEHPEGSAGRTSSVALYFGANARRFARVFRDLGIVVPPPYARIRDTKPCLVCCEPFTRVRSDAVTCSPRCRKRLERSRKRPAESPAPTGGSRAA